MAKIIVITAGTADETVLDVPDIEKDRLEALIKGKMAITDKEIFDRHADSFKESTVYLADSLDDALGMLEEGGHEEAFILGSADLCNGARHVMDTSYLTEMGHAAGPGCRMPQLTDAVPRTDRYAPSWMTIIAPISKDGYLICGFPDAQPAAKETIGALTDGRVLIVDRYGMEAAKGHPHVLLIDDVNKFSDVLEIAMRTGKDIAVMGGQALLGEAYGHADAVYVMQLDYDACPVPGSAERFCHDFISDGLYPAGCRERRDGRTRWTEQRYERRHIAYTEEGGTMEAALPGGGGTVRAKRVSSRGWDGAVVEYRVHGDGPVPAQAFRFSLSGHAATKDEAAEMAVRESYACIRDMRKKLAGRLAQMDLALTGGTL